MKLSYLIIFLLFFIQLPVKSQRLLDELWRVYNSTDLFELEENYSLQNKEKLAPVTKVMYEFEFATLLKQDDKAMNLIDVMLTKHRENLDSLLQGQLIRDKARMLAGSGQCGRASDYIKEHLQFVRDHNDSLVLIDREKSYNEMRDFPNSEICRPHKKSIISYTLRNTPKGWHYIVPVVINGQSYGFIYDICAFSTAIYITEKMVKEMGIKIIGKGSVYGGSGATSCLKATIDSIVIGDIIFRHPYLNINIVQDSSAVSGILGNDFMSLVGSFSIYPKKQKIVFPYKTKSLHKSHNMMYGNGLYFMNAKSGKERILFTLDTGASASLILGSYYNKHKEWFDLHGVKDTATLEEGGRKRVEDFMTINSFPVTVGKTTVNLKKVYAFPNMRWDAFGEQQGVLGTSFFDCFRKVSVNFHDMYLSVEK